MASNSPYLSRRDLLKLGSAAALIPALGAKAAQLAPTTAPVSRATTKSLWVFDPDLGQTPIPAGTTQAINVKDERESQWSWLRASKPVAYAAGITRWSDFLIVRGHLEERGLRLLELRQQDSVFHWVLTKRNV